MDVKNPTKEVFAYFTMVAMVSFSVDLWLTMIWVYILGGPIGHIYDVANVDFIFYELNPWFFTYVYCCKNIQIRLIKDIWSTYLLRINLGHMDRI